MLARTLDQHHNAHMPADTASQGFSNTWRLLYLLDIYRVAIATLFVILPWTGAEVRLLGDTAPALFATVSAAYLVFGIGSLVATRWRWPAFKAQVFTQVLVDILAITLIMHASGGVGSGLGMLLLIAIAGGGILMPGRTAILFAATATLAVLAEQIYAQVAFTPSLPNYTQAGLLGATFFATALLTHVLARRIRETEKLAAQRGVDLANMQQLTEYIIQRMQTGVLVVDAQEKVHLMNESARHLLDVTTTAKAASPMLEQLSPALAGQLHAWRVYPEEEPRTFRPNEAAAALLPRFARMETDPSSGILVFLEDTAVMAQQAQQMKLASLGRLTASIAHEIRNPLGAISHAGQLLAESPALDKNDMRLTQIINEQSQRVNAIIENVMQLSRRDRSRPQEFALKPWLERFAEEFRASENITAEWIGIGIDPPHVEVRIDPSQLHQILWNLCENALRHSASRPPIIELRGGLAPESHVPFLEVLDNGPGIAAGAAEHIFEPFFTTNPKGTGLGLYISRELCECNQARLNYRARTGGGSCFRITFADPRRRQVA